MKHINKLILIAFIFFSKATFGQGIPGYNNSNYAGISGVDLQPACIADMRYAFDMTLFGFGVGVNNNYIGVQSSHILDGSIFKPDTVHNFQKYYMYENTSSQTKSVGIDQYVQLPSFAISITKNISVGFTARERSLFNVDQLSETLAHFSYTGLSNTDPANKSNFNHVFGDNAFNINQMSWMEYGFHYAQVIIPKGPHFLKIGGAVKYEAGIEAAYIYASKLQYSWPNSDSLSLFDSHFNYGHSQSSTDILNNIQNGKYNSAAGILQTATNPGAASVAFDIGAVYEWRPGYNDFTYDMDGQTGRERRDKDKYKLRVGVSIMDLGGLTFKKSNGSRDFTADTINWNVNGTRLPSNPILGVDSLIKQVFPHQAKNPSNTFTFALPTAFSVQVDYNLYKDLYVNFTSYTSPEFLDIASKVHTMSYYALTPRWDNKWFGVFVPFGLNSYGQFTMGTTLRLGPIIVGTSNGLSALVSSNMYGMDFHVAVKIPILYGKPPRDRDHDGVSDRKDKCPDVKGTWEHHGCPDTDGDGVYDDVDICPTVPGPVANHGCPWPDTDGDGIPDNLDSCPKVAGPVENHGCPWGDADGDGVPDNLDSCKFVKGPAANHGCPYGDADNDGIPDNLDSCPHVAGPVENHGCPWGDQDGDGVPDNIDQCPTVPGPASNHGCPLPTKEPEKVVEKKEEKKPEEVIRTDFSNLEFELNRAVIKQISYADLDELAKIMKNHPNFKLEISGHTDNVGSEASNLKLSKARAMAVRTALVTRKVAASRIKVEYFGSSKPIAPNTTEEGRAKNRRVELKLIK